jgi:hypothetical protein
MSVGSKFVPDQSSSSPLEGRGEVLVSGVVPPLVVGSGLNFADHEHELQGVPCAPAVSSP